MLYLKHSSRIAGRTIDSLLSALEKGTLSITKNDVLVIDEAGMVDTRRLVKLLALANERNTKVVLVGDYEQLQPIQAGAPFRAIAERVGYSELNEVMRQYDHSSPDRTFEMREATKEFATQQTAAALARYAKLGNIHQYHTRLQAVGAVVDAWNRNRHITNSQIMLAYVRKDVAMLNAKARDILKQLGALKSEQILLVRSRDNEEFAKAFSINERIYFIKNDLQLGVKNGSLGTLIGIKRNELTVKLDTGVTLSFDLRDYNHIDYGYAATVHKSQGVTVDKAYLLADKYLDRHVTYVGATRHRNLLEIYYDTDTFKDLKHFYEALSRENFKDMVLDYADVRHFEALLSEAREINQVTDKKHAVEDILATYTTKLVELDNLVRLKNSNLAKDPQTAKAYGDQALALDKELKKIACSALEQPVIKRELELRGGGKGASATIAESGGFQGLKTKLEQGQLSPRDIATLFRHMQARAQEVDRSHTRNQDRDQSQ